MDITKVECMLTAPSQVIQGPGKDGELRLAQLHKPRQGQVCLWLFLALASLLLLNASKKIMRHVLGPELERYLVQKASIILFV
jgi:hypothetical protein